MPKNKGKVSHPALPEFLLLNAAEGDTFLVV